MTVGHAARDEIAADVVEHRLGSAGAQKHTRASLKRPRPSSQVASGASASASGTPSQSSRSDA
jgi:hypothetical protein